MGHTNSTANLSLPQFIGSDKPTWLGDINSAFSDIDAYVGTNNAAVSGAVSDAASAVSQSASAVNTANTANTTAGNASTAATNAVGTANNAMSLVNQTNTKIGTLANLNTTDKTSIVNAINEINAKGVVELWVNPSQGSAFAAGNFNIVTDLQIDTLIIDLYDAINNRSLASIIMESTGTAKASYINLDSSGILSYYDRICTITSNATGYNVTFNDCTEKVAAALNTAPTTSTKNDVLVPYRIVGIIHQ